MKKYLIRANIGYGDTYEVVEAGSLWKAEKEAYGFWLEEAESQADYDAKEYDEKEHGDLI